MSGPTFAVLQLYHSERNDKSAWFIKFPHRGTLKAVFPCLSCPTKRDRGPLAQELSCLQGWRFTR